MLKSKIHLWVAVVTMATVFYGLVNPFLSAYRNSEGLESFIDFGEAFHSRALPQIKEHFRNHPSPRTEFGYDAQFYAQIALSPTLKQPELRQALDHPTYRSRRILLPLFANLLGGGEVEATLNVYVLMNLIFWIILCGLLLGIVRPLDLQSLICIIGACTSIGVLTSVYKCLVDLASAVLLLFAAYWGQYRGAAFVALASLSKETAVLGLGGIFRDFQFSSRWFRSAALLCCIALAPAILWQIYVERMFGGERPLGSGNFSIPGLALAVRLQKAWLHQELKPILTIASVLVQAAYLALRRDYSSPYWRMSAPFVVLMIVLGDAVWEAPDAVARNLIPITLASHIALRKEKNTAVFLATILLSFAPTMLMCVRPILLFVLTIVNQISAL